MKKFLVAFIVVLLFPITVLADAPIYYGIKSKYNCERPFPGNEYHDIITDYNGYYIGPDEKVIFLTFDTGYRTDYTESIVKTLDKYNVKGTFFATGGFIRYNSDLVNDMVSNGHVIANHTYNHYDSSKLTIEEFERELSIVEEEYHKVTGKEMMKIFRPPKGILSLDKLKWLRQNKYSTIMWSLAYIDWEANRGWKYSYDKVIDRIHPGAIILMHTCSSDNSEALDDIIEKLINEGYTIMPITYLISDKYIY